MFRKPALDAANFQHIAGVFFGFLFLVFSSAVAGCVPSSAVQPTTTRGVPTLLPSPSITEVNTRTPTSIPTKTPTTAVPESSPSEIPPTTSTTPLPADVVIAIHQTGGFAGVNNSWLIYRDGKIQENGRIIGSLSEKELDALLDEIGRSGFFDFHHPDAGSFCCDFFTITVTVVEDSGTHTISISDGDPDVPSHINNMIALLFQTLSP